MLYLHEEHVKSMSMGRYYSLDIHKDSIFMCIINEFGYKKEHKFSVLGLFIPQIKYI